MTDSAPTFSAPLDASFLGACCQDPHSHGSPDAGPKHQPVGPTPSICPLHFPSRPPTEEELAADVAPEPELDDVEKKKAEEAAADDSIEKQGWEICETDDGVKFYYHTDSGASQWTRPRLKKMQALAKMARGRLPVSPRDLVLSRDSPPISVSPWKAGLTCCVRRCSPSMNDAGCVAVLL